MLLNMGGSAVTTAALVVASLEEALSRGFLVEIDTTLRHWADKPELEGDDLELQRVAWMAGCWSSHVAVVLQTHPAALDPSIRAPQPLQAPVLISLPPLKEQ